jgi:hypothetical protein
MFKRESLLDVYYRTMVDSRHHQLFPPCHVYNLVPTVRTRFASYDVSYKNEVGHTKPKTFVITSFAPTKWIITSSSHMLQELPKEEEMLQTVNKNQNGEVLTSTYPAERRFTCSFFLAATIYLSDDIRRNTNMVSMEVFPRMTLKSSSK